MVAAVTVGPVGSSIVLHNALSSESKRLRATGTKREEEKLFPAVSVRMCVSVCLSGKNCTIGTLYYN